MNAEQAATEIRTAYGTFTAKFDREWMTMTQAAGWAGLSRDELAAGVKYLARTDQRCLIQPEADQGSLTAADREIAPVVGGEAKHLIRWECRKNLEKRA